MKNSQRQLQTSLAKVLPKGAKSIWKMSALWKTIGDKQLEGSFFEKAAPKTVVGVETEGQLQFRGNSFRGRGWYRTSQQKTNFTGKENCFLPREVMKKQKREQTAVELPVVTILCVYNNCPIVHALQNCFFPFCNCEPVVRSGHKTLSHRDGRKESPAGEMHKVLERQLYSINRSPMGSSDYTGVRNQFHATTIPEIHAKQVSFLTGGAEPP